MNFKVTSLGEYNTVYTACFARLHSTCAVFCFAAMAESLVNLTSFKRKMSMDAETVAGPIDVAVISKGDGFIWIKRKHYFERELNPQFFANYYREVENGEE